METLSRSAGNHGVGHLLGGDARFTFVTLIVCIGVGVGCERKRSDAAELQEHRTDIGVHGTYGLSATGHHEVGLSASATCDADDSRILLDHGYGQNGSGENARYLEVDRGGCVWLNRSGRSARFAECKYSGQLLTSNSQRAKRRRDLVGRIDEGTLSTLVAHVHRVGTQTEKLPDACYDCTTFRAHAYEYSDGRTRANVLAVDGSHRERMTSGSATALLEWLLTLDGRVRPEQQWTLLHLSSRKGKPVVLDGEELKSTVRDDIIVCVRPGKHTVGYSDSKLPRTVMVHGGRVESIAL